MFKMRVFRCEEDDVSLQFIFSRRRRFFLAFFLRVQRRRLRPPLILLNRGFRSLITAQLRIKRAPLIEEGFLLRH